MAYSIAITIHEGVQALDVAGPLDVFAEANSYLESEQRYVLTLIAESLEPLHCSNGMRLVAEQCFSDTDKEFDLVLVAGGPSLPHGAPASLVEWVTSVPARAGCYGSICTGAFVLGHAGLLEGKRVTTHWADAKQLAIKFPHAMVEADAIYVRDGRLITSAGVTAGIDLALALVREHHGAQVALAVAKKLVVVTQRQGGQSQFSPYINTPIQPDSPVALIQASVMENMSERHTVQSLADVVGMSTRNLTRYFVEESDVTPYEFVMRARIDAARMLLESSDLLLKRVAYECGFSSVDRMRLAFKQRLGVTPAEYRANFRRADPGMS